MNQLTFRMNDRFVALCDCHRDIRGTVILPGHTHDGGMAIYYVVHLDGQVQPCYMSQDEMKRFP